MAFCWECMWVWPKRDSSHVRVLTCESCMHGHSTCWSHSASRKRTFLISWLINPPSFSLKIVDNSSEITIRFSPWTIKWSLKWNDSKNLSNYIYCQRGRSSSVTLAPLSLCVPSNHPPPSCTLFRRYCFPPFTRTETDSLKIWKR